MDPITQQAVLATAGAAGGDPVYVDDVFSTFLYEGNGFYSPKSGVNTITNGIDLSGEGGLVWIKSREYAHSHSFHDTERGVGNYLMSNSSAGNNTIPTGYGITSFNNNGFTLEGNYNNENVSGADTASWTFRKAPGFFDVVTWTGDGTDGRQIAHTLGSAPGMVFIKCTSDSDNWYVYHSSSSTTYGSLNFYAAFSANGAGIGGYNMQEIFGNSTTVIVPDANNITVARFGASNASGRTYIAYLFANDDASFGTDGNESIIKCGTYVGNLTTPGPIVNLGWEPQWVLIKNTSSGGTPWLLWDNMRGIVASGSSNYLYANDTDADEVSTGSWGGLRLTPTGFQVDGVSGSLMNASGNTYIYIAIRRPNKPPTAGTEVFNTHTVTDAGTNYWTPGFAPDMLLHLKSHANYADRYISSRLTGNDVTLMANTTSVEVGSQNSNYFHFDAPTGTIKQTYMQGTNDYLRYTFKRAPGFFDVVTYTGTGSARQISHNLNTKPGMIICKLRNSASENWAVQHSTPSSTHRGRLNSSSQFDATSNYWNNTEPTSTVFTVGSDYAVNWNGLNYIAYLFGTLPGISKVGTYAGTGNAVNVDCGFSSGARFILIKRSDHGDWYVYDTTRGIVSGNDPYIFLNDHWAQVANTDYIDPLTSGFTVTSSAPDALNASGGTYIFLAIA